MKIRVLQTLEISLKTIMIVRARYQISAQLESSSLGISAWKYLGLILVVNDNSRFSHRHSVIYIFSWKLRCESFKISDGIPRIFQMEETVMILKIVCSKNVCISSILYLFWYDIIPELNGSGSQ